MRTICISAFAWRLVSFRVRRVLIKDYWSDGTVLVQDYPTHHGPIGTPFNTIAASLYATSGEAREAARAARLAHGHDGRAAA